MELLGKNRAKLRDLSAHRIFGKVLSIGGMEMAAGGLGSAAKLGDHVLVSNRVKGEIVGLAEGKAHILPFGSWEGVATGDDIELLNASPSIFPADGWIGRVVDAFGQPMDGADLPGGGHGYRFRNSPPDAFARRSVGTKIETGVKGIDLFVPLCRGQRLGVFAGSGVGKSTLMGMLARQTEADVIVLGLVGERGREVREFIERDLGPEGMKKSVLVVATSDQPPLVRRQAAWTATAIAEYYRDQGKHVLLMIDSVTRFAMAQREIGLAAGEPPTTKGYTPTVFAELPKLLERSGPGASAGKQGDITAIYTVLVDGDDMNEPIADTVRGILDGHLVLDRRIAERGRFPAVNIQASVSRMLPDCHAPVEFKLMDTARQAMARHAEMEDMLNIGAYRHGANPELDCMIAFSNEAEKFLKQGKHDPISSMEAFAAIYGLLMEAGVEISLEEFSEEGSQSSD